MRFTALAKWEAENIVSAVASFEAGRGFTVSQELKEQLIDEITGLSDDLAIADHVRDRLNAALRPPETEGRFV